ncbi:MAG TPA: MFS transporter [Clostridia bacterium]|nr:MFS transporter [Clostridia bacterium]
MAEPQPAPVQPRNVHVFGATSFLNDTASEMAYWILPAFLTTIGAGPATLGIIEGIAESVASFAKLFSGLWTDRLRRRKPLVVSGYVVANAVKPLLALVTAAWQVLVIRFLDRLAKGVRGAPRDVMLSESVPPERVGAAFGLLQAMDSAGAIAGPLLALAIMSSAYGLQFGPRAVFIAAAVPGLLCIAVVALALRETQHTPSPTHKALFASPRALPRRYYYVIFAVTLFSLGNSSDMFLVLRAQELGIPVWQAPLLGLIFNITYTLGSWPAGRLSDRASNGASRGRYAIASAGLLVYAAVYLAFARGSANLGIYTAMAFYGIYYALTQPVLKAIVVDAVGRELRGGAFGIYYFVTSVAALLASTVTGLLWKQYGAAVPLTISAMLALAAAVLLFLAPDLFRHRPAAVSYTR